MKLGATPNAVTSDSESSSAPNRLLARSSRAIRPSMPSRTPAMTTQPIAACQFSAIAKRTPVSPKHKASAVTALGTIARNAMPRSRGAASVIWPWSLAGAGQPGIGADLGDHGFAADRPLAEQDAGPGAVGQIDVDPASEADQADPLAGLDAVAFADERQDPAGDQAGDLGEADLHAVGTLDDEMLALIVLARLVEVGVEEFARHIGDAADAAADRRAVDVDVE